MKTVIFTAFTLIGLGATATPKPFIQCLSSSVHVQAIDIYLVNFKDVPDIYHGTLSACSFVPSPTDSLTMVTTYPAQGSTMTGSDGKQLTFWTAALVVDENKKPKIFYQYSDFVARSVEIQNPTACTQGLFISDDKQVLDFKSNEPGLGMGKATLNGEEIQMRCQTK